MSGGTVAGGIYIIIFVIVAHFDPIGMGIEMVAGCNGKREKYSLGLSMGLCDRVNCDRSNVEIHEDIEEFQNIAGTRLDKNIVGVDAMTPKSMWEQF